MQNKYFIFDVKIFVWFVKIARLLKYRHRGPPELRANSDLHSVTFAQPNPILNLFSIFFLRRLPKSTGIYGNQYKCSSGSLMSCSVIGCHRCLSRCRSAGSRNFISGRYLYDASSNASFAKISKRSVHFHHSIFVINRRITNPTRPNT